MNAAVKTWHIGDIFTPYLRRKSEAQYEECFIKVYFLNHCDMEEARD
jgi:hypothetical protein